MPIIVEYTFKDGSKLKKQYPAQIWRKNDKEVKKLFASDKEIESIKIDPDLLTADIDISNNTWPKKVVDSKIDQFKKRKMKQ